MSQIAFEIRREVPWLRDKPGFSYFFGDSLKKAMSDKCFVSLKVDGESLAERQTSWGRTVAPPHLLGFLRRYRNNPGSTRPEENISDALHSFLFAERQFDAPFGATLLEDVRANRRYEILIQGDLSSVPLLVNLPWELSDGVTTSLIPTDRALRGSLASLPLARVLRDTKAQFTSISERLRVLYCISQPAALGPIEAWGFHQAIEDTLKELCGVLSYESVIGKNFTPTFNQLKIEIEKTRPHVLIIACHGQTLKGVPQLCFEKWHTVSSLADVLAEKAKTFLVILIACDQTHLDDHPAAHSGALTLLQGGILSVVAMQSSVDVLLAKEFLGTMLDSFIRTGAIGLSVAEGRRSMAPTKADMSEGVDWSFPALFLTEDAPEHTDKLARILEAYIPTLNELRRRIPKPHLYLERPAIDQRLQTFLTTGEVGLREVVGGVGTGKTSAIRHACRLALERAAAMKDTSTRPLLYVDFGRYKEIPRNAQHLLEILRKQTEEIQSTVRGTPLLNWTTPTGGSIAGVPTDQDLRQLLHFVDENRMVLICDNFQATSEPFWQEFFNAANDLSHSLVIRLGEEAVITSADHLPVVPFTRDETKEYVKRFAPSQAAQADSWYEETAGVPGLLDELRIENGTNLTSSSAITRNLSSTERDILYELFHLPNGVDSDLATAYVAPRWLDVLRLDQKGLLLRESRFESPWVRLPKKLERLLANDEAKVADGARSLADRFIERIGADTRLSVKEIFINLAKKPGGIDFLHDIHEVFLKGNYEAQARALPRQLDVWLYANGRWFDEFKFWDRLLKNDSENSRGVEWLRLAGAAHALGMRQAEEFIDEAEKRELHTLDKIDARIIRAAVIKDSGESLRKEEVTKLYEEALGLISSAASSGKFQDDDLAALLRRRAQTIYNRALHRRFWLRDLDGALSDLTQAKTEFYQLGMNKRSALADCEWVDVQLGWKGHENDWNEMLVRLMRAISFFESNDGSPADCAFCYYQLARYYRQRPAADSQDPRENIAKAREAYRRASEQANIAGIVRLREIAEGHFVEVSWRELHEISSTEATSRLDDVIRQLKPLKEDAWSARVLRDMLLLRADAARESDPKTVLPALKEAWKIATHTPLHADRGVDARRAARVMVAYYTELEKLGCKVDVDALFSYAKKCIEKWLKRDDIDPTKPREWIADVTQFSLEEGE